MKLTHKRIVKLCKRTNVVNVGDAVYVWNTSNKLEQGTVLALKSPSAGSRLERAVVLINNREKEFNTVQLFHTADEYKQYL